MNRRGFPADAIPGVDVACRISAAVARRERCFCLSASRPDTARCDMWAWNGTTWLSINMAVDPLDRAGPCLEYPNMAWDVRTGGLLVTGGYTLVDGGEYPNHEAWLFKFTDSMSGTWSKATGGFSSCASNVSSGAAMAFDLPSGAKVFFGGFQNFPQTVAVGNRTYCD